MTRISIPHEFRQMLATCAAMAMLSACGNLPARNVASPIPAANTPAASEENRVVIPRFENRIVLKLLAEVARLESGADNPFRDTASVARDYAASAESLRRSVDFSHLYPDNRLRAEDYLVRTGYWQDRTRHAAEFDLLRRRQHTAASIRALFLQAESWTSYASRVERLSAEDATLGQPLLPAGWDVTQLPADLAAAFAQRRHELGISTHSAPFARRVPLLQTAMAQPLSPAAYGVLLNEIGFTISPRALHDLGLARVERFRAQTEQPHAPATGRAELPAEAEPETSRQARLSALATAIGELLPRVQALAPPTGLPDLLIWRVEPSREAVAPMLEYVASPARGLPAVLYVNLAEVQPLAVSAVQLLAGEAVLGHHLAAAWDFEHTDGWAAFVTRPPDTDEIGQRAWRARELERWTWLAVDSGLHGGIWSAAEATQFVLQTTGMSSTIAEREVNTIRNQPAAATAFVPVRRMLETWQNEQQTALPDAGIDEFLRRILGAGDTSPQLLRRMLELEFARKEPAEPPAN